MGSDGYWGEVLRRGLRILAGTPAGVATTLVALAVLVGASWIAGRLAAPEPPPVTLAEVLGNGIALVVALVVVFGVSIVRGAVEMAREARLEVRAAVGKEGTWRRSWAKLTVALADVLASAEGLASDVVSYEASGILRRGIEIVEAAGDGAIDLVALDKWILEVDHVLVPGDLESDDIVGPDRTIGGGGEEARMAIAVDRLASTLVRRFHRLGSGQRSDKRLLALRERRRVIEAALPATVAVPADGQAIADADAWLDEVRTLVTDHYQNYIVRLERALVPPTARTRETRRRSILDGSDLGPETVPAPHPKTAVMGAVGALLDTITEERV